MNQQLRQEWIEFCEAVRKGKSPKISEQCRQAILEVSNISGLAIHEMDAISSISRLVQENPKFFDAEIGTSGIENAYRFLENAVSDNASTTIT